MLRNMVSSRVRRRVSPGPSRQPPQRPGSHDGGIREALTGCLHGDMTVRFPRPLQPGDRIGVTAPFLGGGGEVPPAVRGGGAVPARPWVRRGARRVPRHAVLRLGAEGGAGGRARRDADRPHHRRGGAAVGWRDGDRPPGRPRLGRPGRGGADLAGRVQRPVHDHAAADHSAGLGDPARQQPDGHAVRRARRLRALDGPRVGDRPGDPDQPRAATARRSPRTTPPTRASTRSSWTPSARGPSSDGGYATFSGRLVGGCIEVLSPLNGTPFADVAAYGREHAEDGLVVYLEAC